MIWDYWDGPRSGVAMYAGQPHFYRCEWDEAAHDYGDTFILVPIDQETFSLAKEQWSIWRQWEAAFHNGEVAASTHPGLEGSNPRYAELQRDIEGRLDLQPRDRDRKRATFRVQPGQESQTPGIMRELEVEWWD